MSVTTHAGGPGTAPADEFAHVADPYRRELLAHCYRMTGSSHDAEDLVQETYLRAWRAFHDFEGRSSVRTWLHRIATNVCLTALEGAARRPLPTGLGQPGSRAGDPLDERGEVPWLEPLPDSMVADPADAAESRESIRLAFVAALQHLPPRQRAVLILRDVLRWRAAEVAEALDTTTAAVNSALQRARSQLERVQAGRGRTPSGEPPTPDPTPQQRALLERYVQAFWDKDIDAIVAMLTAEAVWEMPPFAGWYQGAANIGRLIDTQCPGGRHDMVMLPTRANGQPAFGLYMRGEGAFWPFHLQVLTLDGDGVTHVAAFFDPLLFGRFGLPDRVPLDAVPAP